MSKPIPSPQYPVPELSIVMPCLNEEQTLEDCILSARRFLDESRTQGEIVIADNGSTDGSIAIAERCGARVIQIEKRGYGVALIEGIKAARGTYVILGDSDCSYDFSDLGAILGRLRDGYGLVVGNRYRGGIHKGAMPWLHRYIGTPALTLIARILLGSPIRDISCGLRGVHRETALLMGLRAPGMEFASELVAKASLYSIPMAEVPVVLRQDGRDRPQQLRTWSNGLRHLGLLISHTPVVIWFKRLVFSL